MTGFGMGMDVSRKTLGIVGFGCIGQVLAKRARGFDMKVLYAARNRVAEPIEQTLSATYASLDDLLAQSDFVVLLVPYSEATHHLIGATQLARMKKTAVLVNVARGGVVDDVALANALKNGSIAAAALDCVENEPAANPALLGLPNVLFTPHIGSATPATRMNMAMLALRNLATGLAGGVPPNVVNPG
jgi:lactate dehydrogenase-like 2-hydroxyacid dehydrogenase